jgi:hypothetical protein
VGGVGAGVREPLVAELTLERLVPGVDSNMFLLVKKIYGSIVVKQYRG